MLVLTLVAPVFATNCYVLAPAPGRECVVVDVGVGEGLALEVKHGQSRPGQTAAADGRTAL